MEYMGECKDLADGRLDVLKAHGFSSKQIVALARENEAHSDD